MKIIGRILRATTEDLVPINSFDEQDWPSSIILNQSSITEVTKCLKDFAVVNDEL